MAEELRNAHTGTIPIAVLHLRERCLCPCVTLGVLLRFQRALPYAMNRYAPLRGTLPVRRAGIFVPATLPRTRWLRARAIAALWFGSSVHYWRAGAVSEQTPVCLPLSLPYLAFNPRAAVVAGSWQLAAAGGVGNGHPRAVAAYGER